MDFDSKWKALIQDGIPVPTSIHGKDDLEIGVYEGGGYVEKGVYRSTPNSLMKAFNIREFNEVSKQAIIRVIEFYSR